MSAHPGTIATIIGCAFFLQTLDGTMVAIALPDIAASLKADVVSLNIVVTGYYLAGAVILPIGAWLGDRFGARRTFQIAIAIFTVSSALCAASDNVVALAAARMVQGAAAAMMVPVGRVALLRSIQRSDVVKANAYLTIPTQLGTLLGPVLGGGIITLASWRGIFLINIPLGAIAIALVGFFISEHIEQKKSPLDWIGFILTGIGLCLLLFTCDAFSRKGVETSQVVLLAATSVLMGGLALRHARKTAYPLIDFSILKFPAFRATVTGGLLFRIAANGLPFLLPILFQVAFGMDALSSGLLLVASAVGSLAIRVTAPVLLRKFGFRKLLLWNCLMTVASILTLGGISAATPYAVIIVLLLICGALQALQVTVLNSLAYSDVAESQFGSATTITLLIVRVASAFGTAVVAAALNFSMYRWHSPAVSETDALFAIFVIAAVTASSVVFFWRLPANTGANLSGHSLTR